MTIEPAQVVLAQDAPARPDESTQPIVKKRAPFLPNDDKGNRLARHDLKTK